MNLDDGLTDINNARLSRGENPLTKEELVSALDLNPNLLLGENVSEEDRNKILDFRHQEYGLAIGATPSWIKIIWLTIIILVIYGVSRLF